MKLRKFACCSVAALVLFSISGCQWEDTYSRKTFLNYRYKLEACADVHGQDIYSKIWFYEYQGTSYAHLFDLDYEKSYLDMNAGIDENGHAYGYGHLRVAWKDDNSAAIENTFQYFCTMTDTTGGYITSDLPCEYSRFVYCIYWARATVQFKVPNFEDTIELTLHFRGGKSNSYPEDFRS